MELLPGPIERVLAVGLKPGEVLVIQVSSDKWEAVDMEHTLVMLRKMFPNNHVLILADAEIHIVGDISVTPPV